MDIDQDTLLGYAIYNFDNNGDKDIYMFIMNFGSWGDYEGRPIHDEAWETWINTTGNDNNLDVSARDGNLIIVSEREGNIISYHGQNILQNSIDETTIATGGTNPRIDHTGTNAAICTFLMGNTLYASTTEDGGATWSTPRAVIDPEETVAFADVTSFGAVYESEAIIYFTTVGGVGPIPDIVSISGGMGVTVVVKNIGDDIATDIDYSISASGGILGKINKAVDGKVTLAVDEQRTLKLPMIIGLGAIAINVKVGSQTETKSGTQLLIFTAL
jgi:hypothetical protein